MSHHLTRTFPLKPPEVDDVVQDEPGLSNKQRALRAAQNSGLDFSSIPTKVNGREVIKILDDDEEEALNEYIKEEVQGKSW
jgi:hypothetical protein